MKITTEKLFKYGLPYKGSNEVKIIEDIIIGKSRWCDIHKVIFKWVDGKTYRAEYLVGSTEDQYDKPWEYNDDVECTEVHQVEKLVKVWEDAE